MKDINELRQKRGNIIEQTRIILDLADSQDRALTDTEDREYKKLESMIDELGREISREERQLAREAELARSHREGVRFLNSSETENVEIASTTVKPKESFCRNLEERGLIKKPEFGNLGLGRSCDRWPLVRATSSNGAHFRKDPIQREASASRT